VEFHTRRHAVFADNPCHMSQTAPTDKASPFRVSLAALTGGFLAVVLCLLSFAAVARDEGPIVIKFSHVVSPDTPKGLGAQRFKELAEARTGGRVKVEIFPNSQLYKDKEELEALQLGSVQMLAPSTAKFGALGIPEFEVFDLPFLFKDEASFHALCESPFARRLLERLEAKGLKGLAYWDNGFRIFSSNRPLSSWADLKQLRFRIQSSKVLDDQARILGAAPRVMAFADLSQALQAGWVEASENTPSNFYTQRIHESQRHMTLSYHNRLSYTVLVNRKFWEELSPELREQLEGAMRDATVYVNGLAATKNREALAAMRASGKTQLHEVSPAQLAQLRQLLAPVHRSMAARIGRATLDEVYQAAGFSGLPPP
jgi:C4-dicarboxylate-binding protein DctP